MQTLEVISPTGRANLPLLDTPTSLIEGLSTTVREGITAHFDDVAWAYYYGTIERMQTLADPAFCSVVNYLALLDLGREHLEPIDESTRPNIIPTGDDLARLMATSTGAGGGFYRVGELDLQRFVALPAHHDTRKIRAHKIEVDLEHGISFDGHSLVTAMFNSGIEAEIIDYRDEPPFPAYRERAIGEFMLANALPAL